MSETTAATAPAAPAAAAPAPAVAPAPAADTVLGTPAPAAPAATTPTATITADFTIEAPKNTGLDDKRVSAITSMVTDWSRANAAKGITPEIARLLLDTQIDAAKQEAAQRTAWTDALKASRTPDVLHADDVAVTNFVRTNFGEAVVKLLMESGHIANPDIFNGFAKLAKAGAETPMSKSLSSTGATASIGKQNFPRSPLNWSTAERAEWEAAGRPQL